MSESSGREKEKPCEAKDLTWLLIATTAAEGF